MRAFTPPALLRPILGKYGTITRMATVFVAGSAAQIFGATAAPTFSSSFSVASTVAGASMIQASANTTNAVVTMLMGPGMYVVMALGVVLFMYGYFTGRKEVLITGIVGFILAAVFRGIWAFL